MKTYRVTLMDGSKFEVEGSTIQLNNEAILIFGEERKYNGFDQPVAIIPYSACVIIMPEN
jgi:hypothetical protein